MLLSVLQYSTKYSSCRNVHSYSMYIGQLTCEQAEPWWRLEDCSLLALHRAPLQRTITSSSRPTENDGWCSLFNSLPTIRLGMQALSLQVLLCPDCKNCCLWELLHPDWSPPVFLCWGSRHCWLSSIDLVISLSHQDCRLLLPQLSGISRSGHLSSYGVRIARSRCSQSVMRDSVLLFQLQQCSGSTC